MTSSREKIKMEQELYLKMRDTLIGNLPEGDADKAVRLSQVSQPLIDFVNELPEGLEKMQAVVRLHEAMMWAANSIMKVLPNE